MRVSLAASRVSGSDHIQFSSTCTDFSEEFGSE